MAAALFLLLLAAPDTPEIPVRGGSAITLDGRVEEAEWSEAFSVTRDVHASQKMRLLLKRTGPWLAIGLDGDGVYRGQVVRLFVTDASGAWVTNVVLGLGQPVLPPAIWKRGPAPSFDDPSLGPGESPRACLVRLDVGGSDRWSAEALLRLSALGIGRGDLRELRGIVTVQAFDPERRELFALPGGSPDPHDPTHYARLVSTDGWGAAEAWPPVTVEQSREFDDADLLYRLCIEHDKISLQQAPDQLVIATAVRPRSMSRVQTLRRAIEAGRARNPTLPAWTYFLGRLLNEANLYGEALQVVESIPPPLRSTEAFASLAAEVFLDTGQFDRTAQICEQCTYLREHQTLSKLARAGKRAREDERAAVEKDAAKEDKNPRVALKTARGTVVLELFEDDAPAAVRNFMDLVQRRKFYDGLRFHDVQGGRLAMVGDPRTRVGSVATTNGPGWRLARDTSARALLPGYVACLPLEGGPMHGSQFLIALAPLLGETEHTVVFGRVVEGMDVVMQIEQEDLLESVQVLSQRNHGYDASRARLE